MKRKNFLLICLAFLCAGLLSAMPAGAQLCTGSLGDPVVNITFGAGANPGPALSSNLTNISYVSSDCPADGSYTIRNSTGGCFGNTWFNINRDHTGDQGGYFMLVNASYQPSDFYVVKIDGLCTNTTYEFASWIMNILKNPYGIRPNLTFQIEELDGTVLQTYNTGDISVSVSPEWKQYGFFFTTTADASSVIVRIRNNAPGGNGNDLCLDDITFRPCGPTVTASITGLPNDSMSLCEGATTPVSLNGEVLAGYANPTYQWQLNKNDGAGFKDIPGASSTSLTVNPTLKGQYTYRLSVAENGNLGVANCRVNSNEVQVYVRGKPVISFTPVVPVCEGVEVILTAQVSYFSPPQWITDWRAPSPATVEAESFVMDETNQQGTSAFTISQVALRDSGYYRLQVANVYGCSTVDSIRLSVKEKPLASFVTRSAICEDVAVQFDGLATVGSPFVITTYQWDFGNGTKAVTQSPQPKYSDAGSYRVMFRAAASNGCFSDTSIRQVIVQPSPVASFGMPEVCLADPYAEFTNLSAVAGGSAASMQYAWTFGDPSSNSNTSTAVDPRHTYTAVGQYNVTLKATSTFGCMADTMKVFTVNGSVPKSNFRLTSTGILCSADSVEVVNESTVDFGSITRLEVYWDYDRNPTTKSVDENPLPGRSYSHIYSNTPITGTSYRIRYVVYSGINCVNESEQLINIRKSPELSFLPVTPVCQDLPAFKLSQATENTGLPGNGLFTGNGVNGAGLFTPSADAVGSNLITYTYTTNEGCSAVAQQYVTVYPTPVIDGGPDRTMLKGGQITLDATATGNNLQFAWEPTSTVQDARTLKAVVFPASETLYTVTAVSGENCRASDQVLVKVVEFIAIPNAFTPNGDGRNDTWQIPYIESFPTFDVRVYNRYGQLVYQSKNGVVRWDGTLGGKPQDAGTYVYVFDRKQFGGITRGTILLIR